MSRFLIWSPPYRENGGGSICLHYLCHLLNEAGHTALLVPDINAVPVGPAGIDYRMRLLWREWKKSFGPYATHPGFNTPLLRGRALWSWAEEKDIVVYPEVTFGNPLMGRRVVRWMLHDPGFHTGHIGFGPGELYFRYNKALRRMIHHPRSQVSDLELDLVYYPLDLYNLRGALDEHERRGTAYCLRKGRGQKIVHDLSDSVLIDELTHEQTAAVFKRVRRFISYDSLTAYSKFAALCGCESIVVDGDGLMSEEHRQFLRRLPGVSLGFDHLAWARSTRELLREQVMSQHEDNRAKVKRFADECFAYFDAVSEQSPGRCEPRWSAPNL
jgi:hypothetical protein